MKLTPKQKEFLIEAKAVILESLDEGEAMPDQLELDPFDIGTQTLQGLCRKGIVSGFVEHTLGKAITFNCAKVMEALGKL